MSFFVYYLLLMFALFFAFPIHTEDVDLHAVDDFGNTFLHWANGGGRGPTVELLIALGLSVHSTNLQGNTPMVFAAGLGDVVAMEILHGMATGEGGRGVIGAGGRRNARGNQPH